MYPNYQLPWAVVLKSASAFLFNRRRSFSKDAQKCLNGLKPPPSSSGIENIPSSGPCLLTMNHYYRDGFRIWWATLVLSAAVPKEIHWVMTGAWTYPGKWYGQSLEAATHWLFQRIVRVYGFTEMPPMPPRPGEESMRAHAVRKVLSFVRGNPDTLLALAPEGGDQPGGILQMPPPGSGRFIDHLARLGLVICPVGVYEANGLFFLQVGKPYRLEIPAGLSPDERDRFVSYLVMMHIAELLPENLRGEFARKN